MVQIRLLFLQLQVSNHELQAFTMLYPRTFPCYEKYLRGLSRLRHLKQNTAQKMEGIRTLCIKKHQVHLSK